jgi:hypothetical protein
VDQVQWQQTSSLKTKLDLDKLKVPQLFFFNNKAPAADWVYFSSQFKLILFSQLIVSFKTAAHELSPVAGLQQFNSHNVPTQTIIRRRFAAK